ncbi:gp53-like domain-containing protein [Sodalis sp. RH24]|uniref:gp53-like domain-containing protein n=1 Tax=unclassified Sodalis (in: enterobacteria) TaxID=2636512 RepID=UPI0039B3C607
MHRIDTSTAQVDKFGLGKNGFTSGNPQTGEQATALNSDFFDSIQEELAGVVEAAGLTLNSSNNAQLLAAINLIATGQFTAQKSSAGYVKLPNGIVFQWGGASTNSSGNVAVVFPIAFPTACSRVLATNGAGSTPAGFPGVGGLTTTGFNLYSAASSGSASGAGVAYNYFAVGY